MLESEKLINKIIDADKAFIEKYNCKARKEFQLKIEMGPSPYEGDIENSPLVLLLANPGFDSQSSLNDHKFIQRGWPLSALHPDAPKGMHEWWRPRLRTLCEDASFGGVEEISKRISALQINPWASEKFDSELCLPSQIMMLNLAEATVKRGAILIVMRASKLWLQSSLIEKHDLRFKTKSPRCSYVTEGNLGAKAWNAITTAMK